MRNKLSKELR